MSHRYREFKAAHGTVQIVEQNEGRCTVGYKPTDTGNWQHWGAGEGGYAATVARFEVCPCFNPAAPPPRFAGRTEA